MVMAAYIFMDLMLELKSDVAQLKVDVSAIKENIAVIHRDVETVKKDVTDIMGCIIALNRKVDNIKEMVNCVVRHLGLG